MSVRDRVAIFAGKISRSVALPLVCAVAVLPACTRDFSSDPKVSYSAEIPVQGDADAMVTRELPAGTHLIEVRERGIDLRLTVEAGGASAELADDVPRHGVFAKVVSLPDAGSIRIKLRSMDHRARHGGAIVRVATWQRTQSAPASERELGYVAFGTAGERMAAGTKESWTEAVARLHEAIAHFEAGGDDAARAQAQYSLSHLEYFSRMEWLPAIRAAEQAADTYSSLDDEMGEHDAETLRAAAELEVAAGMNAGTQRAEQKSLYEKADRRLVAAAKFFATQGPPVNAQYAVNMRGIRALYQGAYEEAGKLFEDAAQMARDDQNPGAEALSLSNLAWVHNRLGFVAQAAQEYERLLPLIEKDRQPAQYAILLGNYGFCLVALGDFDRALDLHTQALQLYGELHNEAESGRQLAALGALHFRTGDMQRALEVLRGAIVVQKKVGDAIAQAATLRIAGNAAGALEDHQAALGYLRESAEIDADPHSVARTRVLIAGELRALGDLSGAEAELAHAFESTNAVARADALGERGRLRIAQKRYDAAIEDLRAADQQFAGLGLDFSRINANTAIAQAWLATGKNEDALRAADQAVSIVRRIRVKSANPEWRAHFLSSSYSPYEMRIAAQLAAGGDDSASAWQAFLTSEEVRARSLADQLARDARGADRQADPEGDALRAQLTSLQLRLETRIQRQDIDEAQMQALRRTIVETRAQIDARALQHDGVTAGENKLPHSLAELQAKIPADTAVLAFFVGDSATHAWLLTRTGFRHAALEGRKAMQRLTDTLIEQQRRGGDPAATLALTAKLSGRLLDEVHEHRLLVIPDGPLNGVPFAALPAPGASDKLLVDQFVIGYAPSLTLAMTPPRDSGARHTRVAVISDPVYAPDDRRLVASAEAAGTLRGAREPSFNNLTRLPYSAMEARAVLQALGSRDAIELAGLDASSARVLQLTSEKLGVLHFATHALARRDLPEQSALYLSEYAADGSRLADSRLTAGQITRSGLHADVVVLSGCATGDGGALRGEGVLGLTYGFLSNGSRSVVAALWPIEDAATARFMNEFYRAYRGSGRAADALRTAQMRTRHSAKASVWSSFVVRANEFP